MGRATFLLEALENSLLRVVPEAWQVDPTCGPLSNSAEDSYERDLTCSYKLTTRWEFYCCCSNCMIFKCDLFRWQHGVTCQKARYTQRLPIFLACTSMLSSQPAVLPLWPLLPISTSPHILYLTSVFSQESQLIPLPGSSSHHTRKVILSSNIASL